MTNKSAPCQFRPGAANGSCIGDRSFLTGAAKEEEEPKGAPFDVAAIRPERADSRLS